MGPQCLWNIKGLHWLSWLFNPCIIASLHFYQPIQNKSCWLFADPGDCEIRDSWLQHQDIVKQQCKTHHWNKVMVRKFLESQLPPSLCSIIKYSLTLTPSFFLLLPLLPPRKRKQAVRTANPGTNRIPKIIRSILTSSLSSMILTLSWGRLKWQTFLNKLHFNPYKFHFLLSNYIHQLGSCSIISLQFTFTRPIDFLQ